MLFNLVNNLSKKMNTTFFISINENIVYIENYKNINFLSQDLINVALKTCLGFI